MKKRKIKNEKTIDILSNQILNYQLYRESQPELFTRQMLALKKLYGI